MSSVLSEVAKTCLFEEDGPKKSFSKGEIGWFTVKSYNRGINMVYMGAIDTASTLLRIALNLVPHSDPTTMSYTGQITSTYEQVCRIESGLSNGSQGADEINGGGESGDGPRMAHAAVRGAKMAGLFTGLCPSVD